MIRLLNSWGLVKNCKLQFSRRRILDAADLGDAKKVAGVKLTSSLILMGSRHNRRRPSP